ncbi:hypothetical protein OIDMADRAFT_136842, partial [Oidiodendron maius Zn]
VEKTLGTRPLLTGTIAELHEQFMALSSLTTSPQRPLYDFIDIGDDIADGIPIRIRSKVFTAGTSAGGGLALNVTDALIEEGHGSYVQGVVAIVPITAYPSSVPVEYKSQYTSYEENGSGVPIIDASTMKTLFEAAGCKYDDPRTFVTLSQNLSQFPPTYISTCGKDPLRDDGKVLEAMLKKLDVKTRSDHYSGVPHSFWLFPNMHGEDVLANAVSGAQWILSNLTQL